MLILWKASNVRAIRCLVYLQHQMRAKHCDLLILAQQEKSTHKSQKNDNKYCCSPVVYRSLVLAAGPLNAVLSLVRAVVRATHHHVRVHTHLHEPTQSKSETIPQLM